MSHCNKLKGTVLHEVKVSSLLDEANTGKLLLLILSFGHLLLKLQEVLPFLEDVGLHI